MTQESQQQHYVISSNLVIVASLKEGTNRDVGDPGGSLGIGSRKLECVRRTSTG